jgi:hypothetical protein
MVERCASKTLRKSVVVGRREGKVTCHRIVTMREHCAMSRHATSLPLRLGPLVCYSAQSFTRASQSY